MVGKDTRCIRKPAPFRFVAPFSTAAYFQPNVKAKPLKRLGIYEPKNVSTTLFRKMFLRGDIPCQISYNRDNSSDFRLMWKVLPKDLDVAYYLPLFFDGLLDTKFPYNFIAKNGFYDMLKDAVVPGQILEMLPIIIKTVRKGLSTRNPEVIVIMLDALQVLIKSNSCLIGPALIPYYNQILPTLNMYYNSDVNLRDKVDFKQSKRLGSIVDKTIQMLEICGGAEAFSCIKYSVPAYESVLFN